MAFTTDAGSASARVVTTQRLEECQVCLDPLSYFAFPVGLESAADVLLLTAKTISVAQLLTQELPPGSTQC